MTIVYSGNVTRSSQHYSALNAGFTIVELMMTLIVAAILVSVAVPAFNSLIRSNELRSSVSTVNSTLAHARSEAVARRTNVAVCGSTDGSTCLDSDTWTSGLLTFVDNNGDGKLTTGDCDPVTDCILRVRGAMSGQVTLKSTAEYVAFDVKGALVAAGSNSLRVCGGNAAASADTEHSRTVSLSVSGSARAKKGTSSCP